MYLWGVIGGAFFVLMASADAEMSYAYLGVWVPSSEYWLLGSGRASFRSGY